MPEKEKTTLQIGQYICYDNITAEKDLVIKGSITITVNNLPSSYIPLNFLKKISCFLSLSELRKWNFVDFLKI